MVSVDVKHHVYLLYFIIIIIIIITIININDIVILFMHGPNIFFKQEICFHDQVPGQNTVGYIQIMHGFSGLYGKQIPGQINVSLAAMTVDWHVS